MKIDRKKQLREEYKNRKPEMGIMSYQCIATGEIFMGIAFDTTTYRNGTSWKLNTNTHPNKQLLGLWSQYGEQGFEVTVQEVLEYEDPSADYTSELEELLEQCLSKFDGAKRIWK